MSDAASILASRRERLVVLLTRSAVSGLFSVVAVAAAFALCTWWCLAAAADALVARDSVLFVISLALVCIVAALCIGLLRVLWSVAALPDGVRLPPLAADALHEKVGQMSAHFGGVGVDAVWITGDMNAAVVQRPRWGLVGRMQTHLLIGLPLAHSISPQQFSAVLAHEFGHLSLQRTGAAAWARHLVAWWFRVSDGLVERLPCTAAIIDRWTRADLVRAIELAHVDEFEADAAAARRVGAESVASALLEVAIKERFLFEDYWCKVLQQSMVRPRPLIRPYREMALGMSAGFRAPETAASVMSSLHDESSDCADPMHPTVWERLEALGMPVDCLDPGSRDEETVADRLLKPLLPSLSLVFDRAWWLGTREMWIRSHRRATRSRRAQRAVR